MEPTINEIVQSLDRGLIYQEDDGRAKFINKAAASILGLEADAILGQELSFQHLNIVYENGLPCPPEEFPPVLSLRTGKAFYQEIRGIRRNNDSLTWLSIDAKPVFRGKGQNPTGVISSYTDISDIMWEDEEKTFTADILQLVNNATDRRTFIKSIITRLKIWSGCEAVGIRLREGEDYPYYETSGFSNSFVKLENSLCTRDDRGEILRDSEHNPILECMCGNILQGRYDPTKVFFTNGGSFWSSCTTDLLAKTTEKDRQARTRNRCNGVGYESVALIPLRTGGETFGLIQLNDKKKNRFSEEKILLLERLAEHVAVFLAKIRAEEDRREREAELAAIYESAPLLMMVVDKDRKILRINGFGQEHNGGSETEIIGLRGGEALRCLNALEDPRGCGFGPHCTECTIRQAVEDTLTTGKGHHQVEGQLPLSADSGKEDRTFLVSTSLISVSGEPRVLISIMDITQWKKAEEAYKASEERFRSMAMLLPEIIFETDTRGQLTFANKVAFERLGYSQEDFEKGVKAVDMLIPQERDRATQNIKDALAGKGQGLNEYTGRTKDGDTFPCLIRSAPIVADGVTVGLRGFVVDITERKEAELKLRERERLLQDMGETAKVGGWEFDVQTLKGTWTDEVARIHDLDPVLEPDARLGLSFYEGDSLERIKKAINEAIEKGRSYDLELEMVTAKGNRKWVRTIGHPVIKGGRTVRLRGAFQDITEQVRNLEALHKSEEQFRNTFENAPEGMALVDQRRRFVRVNSRVCEILGYPENELIGKSFNLFTHPDDRETGRERWKELLSGKVAVNRGEKRFITKDGESVWVSISNTALNVGKEGIKYILSHIQDITDRKAAEEALRFSEEKFAKAFQHSPLWVAITTMQDGRFIEVNETFLKATGFSKEEVIGRTALDLGLRSDPSERKNILELVKEQGSVRNLEVKRKIRSGEILEMLLSVERLPMPGEEALIVVLADITELKKYQNEKDNLESQLRQVQKMEALGNLAGGIAHDFNNILAAIMGYSELVLESTPVETKERGYVYEVIKAASRARELVKQILTFSRKVEVDTRPLNLNNCVTETMRLIKHTIPKMIDVELHLSENLKSISGDPVQLEQVVMNLATNARDAMPEGGRLVVETADVLLDEEYCGEHFEAKPGNYVRLQLSDTGEGMDKETIRQIFDPFFTTKEEGKGTGLGLSTVYGIVKTLGGFIFCYSELGRGTVFKVYFPALKQDEKLDDLNLKKRLEKPVGGHETILLVDDEAVLREMGNLMLKNEGYKIITAEDGETALEIYKRDKDLIDLIILDVSMPGMGGHKCLLEIIKIDPEAKVIIASGYSANGQLKETLSVGALGYIAKPFERATMLKMIRNVLDSK